MTFKWPDHWDWRLKLYVPLTVAFWFLALGPGDGGTHGVGMGSDGAFISFLLLIPLWKGSG